MKKSASLRSTQNISSKRKGIFYIIMFLIPFIFFVVAELTLRILNYGPDLSLFQINIIHGKEYFTLNPSVKNRYFSKSNFIPDPSPENFLVKKPVGAYRIFCLGGSTTVGFPYWYNGSFPSFLRDRLRTNFPNRIVEVVNVGMTATNSYTVVDLARELVEYQPDLFIVYDGHNEFYGALGVASNEQGISERWLTKLYLRVIHLRTFQLVNDLIIGVKKIFAHSPADYSNRTTMMEQLSKRENIPFDSDIYLKVYGIFKDNLLELTEICRSHNIPLILGTQVSNLRDQFPFISNHSSTISEDQKINFEQHYKSGLEFQSKGLIDSAIILFRSAIKIDSLYADVHYRLAQCLDALDKKSDALKEYILAKDYDELRFRTDSKFNYYLIRSMKNIPNCYVADIENVFRSVSPNSLIGKNIISEHLHPLSKGNFIIAKEYVKQMRENRLFATFEDWSKCDKISDDSLWRNKHLTDLDEYMAEQKIAVLTAGWPFRKKYEAPSAIPKTDTLRFIAEQAIHNHIGWITAHEQAAEFYMLQQDFTKAAKEYKTINNQLPFYVHAYVGLAKVFFRQGNFDNAEDILIKSLQLERTATAYRALGDIYLNQNKPDAAIRCYNELEKFPLDPATSPESAYMLALAYLIWEKPEQAIQILNKNINLYPAYKPLRELLTKVKLLQSTNRPM